MVRCVPDPLPRFGDRRRTRVGLLGGSFNPAHEGHRHVAALALRRLGLDQVWLLVSPGNPLKPRAGMAPFANRLLGAAAIGDGRRVVATAIEATFGTSYTIDTLRLLRRRFPRIRFVWIMGADILTELPRWRRWRDIARDLPFVVLPRLGFTLPALAGQAARCLRARRRPAHEAPILARARSGWVFLPAPPNATSATAIRAAAKPTPFANPKSGTSPKSGTNPKSGANPKTFATPMPGAHPKTITSQTPAAIPRHNARRHPAA